MEFTYVAGEVKDPVRTYPRALFIGMAIIVPVYLIINAAYLYTLPLPAMAKSSLVAETAASATLGPRGAAFVSALVMLSTFGALNGSLMASPRVWYAMANDGVLLRRIGAVHPRNHTPYVALTLNMILGLVAVFTHTFEQLTRTFVLGRWPFITLRWPRCSSCRAGDPTSRRSAGRGAIPGCRRRSYLLAGDAHQRASAPSGGRVAEPRHRGGRRPGVFRLACRGSWRTTPRGAAPDAARP
jgi:hypothetical protein